MCAATAVSAAVKPLHTVEGIKSFELDNGLQVVLFADQSKPTATVNTTYLVGSRMENYGETGMAHLLEHLMFKGSKNYPTPTKDFTTRGMRFNGTTWLDRTNYFVSFTASDDNMKWALGWAADAMVNSFIAKKDLDTEMTVVRNEYEMGENKPLSVMMKRMQSVLFDWHSYGRSTIGARSDIENVPIENIQAFYRKWYQPDNAVLTVSGRFDEKKVLSWIEATFGKIPRPTRVLPKEWTVEPVADGPRYFEIRRPGEMKLVSVGYRIPSALADDITSVETAVDVLSDAPRGRLYKALVETGLASNVFGWSFSLKDPGFVMFGATLAKDGDADKVRQILVDTIENTFKKEPAKDSEVKVSLAGAETEFERTLSDPEQFAVDLSDYISLGDWRYFFVDRDNLKKVSAATVDKAAATYFVRDNRVVGVFVPDDHPQRAPYMTTPKLADVMAHVQFKEEGDTAEAFDVSQANIDARTERLEINGIKVALLPKKTRGQTVTVSTHFTYGNLKTATGHSILDTLVEPMLSRGAPDLTRTQIADEMTKLKMEGDVLGYTTTRDNLIASLRLMGKLASSSTFPEKEVTQLVDQFTTMISGKSDDPMILGRDAMRSHFATYPAGDPRNMMTTKDTLAALKTINREKLWQWYQNVVATTHGEVAIVGDFDVAAVKAELKQILGAKKAKDPSAAYERYFAEYKPVKAMRQVVNTPAKENAALFARIDFAGNLRDKDAPAMVIADWILGGGTGLSNRLAMRIRQKEGLSYGVGSQVRLPLFGNRATWAASAIVAPQNIARAEVCLKEELARALKDGFTQAELDEAKKGFVETRAVSRAQDEVLAQNWLDYLDAGETFAFSKHFEDAVQKLTLEDVNAAFRKMVVLDNVSFVLAGDQEKAKAAGKPF